MIFYEFCGHRIAFLALDPFQDSCVQGIPGIAPFLQKYHPRISVVNLTLGQFRDQPSVPSVPAQLSLLIPNLSHFLPAADGASPLSGWWMLEKVSGTFSKPWERLRPFET